MYCVGQIVFSKSGRDKGMAFVIVDYDESYVYIADGRLRKLEKPKRKNRAHIQITNYINDDVKYKLAEGLHLMNSDIRKALAEYNNK